MAIDRLYKFGSLNEYSETLFCGSSIWQPAPSSLNDPFECSPSFAFTHEPEKIMAQLVRAIRKQNPSLTHNSAVADATTIYLKGRHRDPQTWLDLKQDLIRKYRSELGLYCLTERRDSILMWSHYAADHTGYCLEFEATDYTPVFGAAQQVSYSKSYPEIDFYNTPEEERLKLSLLTKFEDWSYEREWRIIDHKNGPGCRQYPPELLKSVTLGLRMKDEPKAQIQSWLKKRPSPVRVFQAVQSESRFELTFEEIE